MELFQVHTRVSGDFVRRACNSWIFSTQRAFSSFWCHPKFSNIYLSFLTARKNWGGAGGGVGGEEGWKYTHRVLVIKTHLSPLIINCYNQGISVILVCRFFFFFNIKTKSFRRETMQKINAQSSLISNFLLDFWFVCFCSISKWFLNRFGHPFT